MTQELPLREWKIIRNPGIFSRQILMVAHLKYHWPPRWAVLKNFREIKGNLRVLSVNKRELLKTKVL